MPLLVFESLIPATPQELWEFHSSVEALPKLTPPGAKVIIVGSEVEVKEGAIHRLRITRNGLPLAWEARIHDVVPGRQFRDTALKSPFPSWTHLHEFLPHPEGSLLRDTVEYKAPGGPLAGVVDSLLLQKDIRAMFAHRHQVVLDHFRRRSS